MDVELHAQRFLKSYWRHLPIEAADAVLVDMVINWHVRIAVDSEVASLRRVLASLRE